jgi:hypothetical protein
MQYGYVHALTMDENFTLGINYLRPRPTSQRINPIIATTIRIPTHMPALKMPPITSHELSVIAMARAESHNEEIFFMSLTFLGGVMQKLCRGLATKAPGHEGPQRRNCFAPFLLCSVRHN